MPPDHNQAGPKKSRMLRVQQASQFTTIALRRSRWQVADGPWRYYWRAGAEPAPIMEFTSAICRSIASTA